MLVFPNGTKCIPETVEQQIGALNDIMECYLSYDGEGAASKPKLIVVSQKASYPQRSDLDEVMRQAGLFPMCCSSGKKGFLVMRWER